MSRLDKYNRVMLAITCTAFLAGIIFIVSVVMYESFLKNRPRYNQLHTETELKEARNEGLRQQKATFVPVLLHYDNAAKWSWSIVSAQVKTLEKAEPRARRLVAQSYSSNLVGAAYGADTINILLTHKDTNETRLLFQERLKIKDTGYFGNDELDYVLMVAEKSGAVSAQLFHYSIKDHQLSQIDLQGYVEPKLNFANYRMHQDLPTIMLAEDTNKDGVFNIRQEIQLPFAFDPITKSLKPLVSTDQARMVQKILDGESS